MVRRGKEESWLVFLLVLQVLVAKAVRIFCCGVWNCHVCHLFVLHDCVQQLQACWMLHQFHDKFKCGDAVLRKEKDVWKGLKNGSVLF